MGIVIDRTGEVNGLIKVLYRGADTEDRYVIWICVCACCPESKFPVLGCELARTLSCGCLPPKARRTRSEKVSEMVLTNLVDEELPLAA